MENDRPLKLRILRAVPVLLVLGLLVHFLLPRLDTTLPTLIKVRLYLCRVGVHSISVEVCRFTLAVR